jgi:uncharacterized protein (UPF0276 family)
VTDLRERGIAVVPHGVRLSLGGAEPVAAARVAHLAACAAAVDAPLVSEHLAFVRAGGVEVGHLLPPPRSRDALDALVANVRRTQSELDVPLALEPVAAFLDWPDDDYTEGEFLTALLDRTGALLLLDVANVHANARNRGVDPEAVLDTLPLDRVAYIHVAGGSEHPGDDVDAPGIYHDTHTDPVPDAVLRLLASVVDRIGHAPPTMLERDGRYPTADELNAEMDAIEAVTPPTRESRAHDPRVARSTPASRAVRVRVSPARACTTTSCGPRPCRGPCARRSGGRRRRRGGRG